MPFHWSIKRKITLLSAFLTLLLLVVGAAASYVYMQRILDAQQQAKLENASHLIRQHLREKLDGLSRTASELARNTLVANALVDDLGRKQYLPKYLADVTQAGEVPVRVNVADFQGVVFGGKRDDGSLPAADWVAAVVAENRGRSVCTDGSKPGFTLAEPIIYANTGLPEGALLLSFAAADLIYPKHFADLLALPELDPAQLSAGFSVTFSGCQFHRHYLQETVPQGAYSTEFEVSGEGALAGLQLRLQIYLSRGEVTKTLQRLLVIYLVIGLVTIPPVFLLARMLADRITRGLRGLQITASDIAARRAFDQRLEIAPQADVEVRALAEAFNQTLESLSRATREIRRTEQRLSSHIEATPIAVITTDYGLQVTEWNPAAERIFGISRTEALGQDLGILVEEFGAASREWLVDTGVSPANRQLHLSHLGPDGRSVDCEWHLSRLPHHGGYGILIQDISADLRAREAERANRAKSAFLANMSHELRTPLNAMLGYAQILARDQTLSDRQRAAAKTIRRSGDYLLTLINDVLDLAKIEAGRFDINPGPCEIEVLFRALGELFEMRALEKGLRFEVEGLDSIPPMIEADEKRLRQVVVNLLGNAMKFTESGSVILRVGYREDVLSVEVEDTGIGIPPEHADELFQPFQQVGSDHYKSQGAGLGLAISRSLVKQMGGDIEVSSDFGRGSRFSLRIPAKRLGELPKTRKEAPWSRISGYRRTDQSDQPLRLLVVDDVADNRAILVELLEPLGFETIEAENGRQGVELAASAHPDLVLMDLVMPDITGLEATQRILGRPELASLPVVACSAKAFSQDRELSLAGGCRDHIAKPVQAQRLYEALGRLLPLEWIIKSEEQAASGHETQTLSEEERQAMLLLARRGDVRALRQRLDHFAESENPLICDLRDATAGFDLKRVRALLEKQGNDG